MFNVLEQSSGEVDANMKKRRIVFSVAFFLLFFLLIYFSLAEIKDLVDLKSFNTSTTATGAGFVAFSNRSGFTNGSLFLNQNFTNEYININVSFITNGSHGGYTNVTFGLVLQSNGSYMINTTTFNNSFGTGAFNRTAFNLTVYLNSLAEGQYNMTILVDNSSMGSDINAPVNYSYAAGRLYVFAVDRSAPNIASFGLNFTNGTNFTATNFGSNIT
ncbi:MAG: hypothetical protein AABX13_03395, partial [Nanoarchaeota archaeon]